MLAYKTTLDDGTRRKIDRRLFWIIGLTHCTSTNNVLLRFIKSLDITLTLEFNALKTRKLNSPFTMAFNIDDIPVV